MKGIKRQTEGMEGCRKRDWIVERVKNLCIGDGDKVISASGMLEAQGMCLSRRLLWVI